MRRLCLAAALLTALHFIMYRIIGMADSYELIQAAAMLTFILGAVAGAFCRSGESRRRTVFRVLGVFAVHAVIVLTLAALGVHERVLFPSGMTEYNYLSASNRAAEMFIIIALIMRTAMGLLAGGLISDAVSGRKHE